MKNIMLVWLYTILGFSDLTSQITIDVSNAGDDVDINIEYSERLDQTKYSLQLTNCTNFTQLTSILIGATTIAPVRANYSSNTYSDPQFKNVIDSPAGGLLNGNDFTIKIVYNSKTFTRNIKFINKVDPTLNDSDLLNRYIKGKWGAFARRYYNSDLNIVLAGKTIHVFLDEYGKFYFSSLPTTARDDYNYQFHFFYINDGKKDFGYTVKGTYDPKFEIYGADNIDQLGKKWALNSTSGDNKPAELITGNAGPFTEQFNVTFHNIKDKKIIFDKNVKVAKTHHVSLGVGLFSTLLRNPTNIKKVGIPGTVDSTFVADDPSSRGFLTIMATFYPKPRNLLYPSTNWKEKFGFTIGTALNQDQFKNFFGGLSFDAARGLSIVAGVHYGRKTVVEFDPKFDFGSQVLPDPNQQLITNEQWSPGFFLGTVIDFRIFELLFRPSIAR